jgi:N6-adenosine-specific RNA methylase IME4
MAGDQGNHREPVAGTSPPDAVGGYITPRTGGTGDLAGTVTELVVVRSLAELEAVVESGLPRFIEVGLALAEIRDRRLYHDAGFANFEDYCQERWGWSRVRAHQLIKGARYALEVSGKTLTIVNESQARAASKKLRATEAPEGQFSTIVADPPWQYSNKATRAAAVKHYPTMTLDAIKEIPVSEWAAPEAHLYLWTTNGFLREAFEVVDAWGFTYKTLLTWVKTQIGIGNYFRPRTEHVLFAVRGKLGTKLRTVSNVIEAPRGKHSAKPGAVFDVIERMSYSPGLEMFARERRMSATGDFIWEWWGNQA